MSGYDVVLVQLCDVVGNCYVLIGDKVMWCFCCGYCFGDGLVLVVVCLGMLLELWCVLQVVVQGGVVIILQVVNIGLIGGLILDGDDYGWLVVLVSMLCLIGIQLLNEGCQVLCLFGVMLDCLEQMLVLLGCELYLVIGLFCIGVLVLGGICNNFGGVLV